MLGAWGVGVTTGIAICINVCVVVGAVRLGYVATSVLLFLLPTYVVFAALTAYLCKWYIRALSLNDVTKTPRRLFHAIAYLVAWGLMIPAFMFHLKPIP